MQATPNKMKKRLILIFAIVCLVTVALCFRVGWIQIVNGAEYSKEATEQQTRDVPIPAKRGTIVDRNGHELAVSAVTFSVWATPGSVRSGNTDEKRSANVDKVVNTLSEILQMDIEEVRALVTKNVSLVKVAKYQDKETVDKIRDAGLPGIQIAEDVKRYYPHGTFASHVLGSVTDDNNGLAGLELRYNQYLAGVPGRWIKNTDVVGNGLSYGTEKYYQAEDGLSIQLTIDEVIQHYIEKSIETVQANTEADRVMCLMMNPKTGEILGMAMTPEYDPNNPRVPLDEAQATYVSGLSDTDKLAYWNVMWRNPMISDVYEPGSTFKLLTTSMALEEGVTSLSDRFVCTHNYNVAGTMLHCWKSTPHGAQNLVEAVGNSCNPVFIQLAQRMGEETYYQYLGLFGLPGKTGIDFPGEGLAILQPRETAGPVGLATMAYGQGIALTPIQMLTAISALGNGGKLLQPRFVKALVDSDGNVVEKFDTKVIRQVISEETAAEMCLIMESVVAEGGGGNAKVDGYRVGGKTGTASKVINGTYADGAYYSSFVGMAPMDDPQVAILLIVDTPKGSIFGSTTAAPGVQQILSDTLRYLNIEPTYTQEELAQIESKLSIVPNVKGDSFSEAIGKLGGVSLTYTVSPAMESNEDFIVVDQYPKAGEKLNTGGSVYLYRE